MGRVVPFIMSPCSALMHKSACVTGRVAAVNILPVLKHLKLTFKRVYNCVKYFRITLRFNCSFPDSEWGKGSWERSSRPGFHSQEASVLLGRCGAGSSDADRAQSRVGAWWSGLSHKEEKLLLPRQGHSGLLSLSPRQTGGGRRPHPAAISARQRPITSRQRANSKHTWIKLDGSAWSPVAKVGVVIISDMLKL